VFYGALPTRNVYSDGVGFAQSIEIVITPAISYIPIIWLIRAVPVIPFSENPKLWTNLRMRSLKQIAYGNSPI
jgi:hypothetical protein